MNKFKVGDRVRVKKREGDPLDYPFSFSEEMAEWAGNIYTIKRIDEDFLPDPGEYKFGENDSAAYYLKEVPYTWHSSMLESCNTSLTPSLEHYLHLLEGPVISEGDWVFIGTLRGKVTKSWDNQYYLDMQDSHNHEYSHEEVCEYLKCDYKNATGKEFEEAAAIYGASNSGCIFPEFPDIGSLEKFIDYVSKEFEFAGIQQLKQKESITQKIEQHEIKFQNPKTSIVRGIVPEGHRIRSKEYKASISRRCIEHRVIHC